MACSLATVSVAELGIGYPVIVQSSPIRTVQVQKGGTPLPGGGPPPFASPDDPSTELISLKRYDFILQFAWQPTTPGSKASPPKPADPAVSPTP